MPGTIREHSELSVFSCLADARRELIFGVSQEVKDKLLILNGGQRRDRTADAGLFRAILGRHFVVLESFFVPVPEIRDGVYCSLLVAH